MKQPSGFVVAVSMVLGTIAVALFWVTVLIVAAHFIGKFW